MTQQTTWRSLTQKTLSDTGLGIQDKTVLTKMLIAIEMSMRVNHPLTTSGTFRNLVNSKQLTADNHERLMQFIVDAGIASKTPALYGEDEVYPLDDDYYDEYKVTGEIYHPETGELVKNDELTFGWEYTMLVDPEALRVTSKVVTIWYDLPKGAEFHVGDRVMSKSIPEWLVVTKENKSIVKESFRLGSVIAHMRSYGTRSAQSMFGYDLKHETYVEEGIEL